MEVATIKDFCTQTTQILKVSTTTMSFIDGGYREGEIDGKPFLIFTFLTQPNNPSSSSETTTVSGGNNDLLQPLFICPTLRFKAEKLTLERNDHISDSDSDSDAPDFVLFSISPHFPTSDQQVQDLLDSDGHISDSDSDIQICKEPIAPLFWCNNQGSVCEEIECNVCRTSDVGTNYYFCVACDQMFHKECVESPLEIKHPSHPFLSFHLSVSENYELECICCKTHIEVTCYYCPTSKLSMHPVCATKPIPLVIDHPKRHPHPLTFFPKQAFLPCNVCGLIKESVPTYLCIPCVSVFHQDCAYSPNVIRISRHHHRIAFTSSLPSGKWSCGVCRKEVDNKYGAYACKKCDGYFCHTRCALRRDLWDGEELEGVPEEPEIVVEPFKRIADGIIHHFSHDDHHLKLEVNRVDDKDKFCQACILPVNFEDEFYSCINQCDFVLHEACARAPRKKHHPLHAHPLTLKVVTNQYQYRGSQGFFDCDACERESCGFVYESDQGRKTFRLDLRCASVSEPFEYEGHEHPLFLALTPEEEQKAVCQICRVGRYSVRKLNCIECRDYIICFRCATLPYKARYKHDKHLLTFRKEKEESDESGWCELCEKKLVYSQNGGFYSCNDYCGTTLHVDCLLGRDPYMMRPGQTITRREKEIHIVSNNTMSRPFCHYKYCDQDRRCPYGVIFKKDNLTFCSFICVPY